jgi:Predicted phosphohydrolases
MRQTAAQPVNKPTITRRRLLQGVVAGSALMAAGMVDSWLVEPGHLMLRNVEIWLEQLPYGFDGLRIAQLSDFHYVNTSDGRLIHRAVELANSLKPDIVALTGDYVTSFGTNGSADSRCILPCAEILSDLRTPLGVFAVLGNHDYCDPQLISRTLESHGIAVLRNLAIYIERNDERLWIAGIEDVLTGKARLDQTLKTVPEAGTTILLAHEPDFAEVTKKYRVALQLSGHSHGVKCVFRS